MKLKIDDIRRDLGTQPRGELNQEVVSEYAAAMARGEVFPAVDVVYDGDRYILVDGFHRIRAAKTAGIVEIEANVSQGTLEDARWSSFGVNARHGLRRTNSDKERATVAALKHKNAAALTNVEIAKHVGVDEKTVRKYRAQLESVSEIPRLEERTRSDGKSYPSHPQKPEPEKLSWADRPSWVDRLQADKWYPVKAWIKHIWDDPFDAEQAMQGDPRYRFSFTSMRGGMLMGQAFWGYTLGDAAPAPSEEQLAAVKQDDQERAGQAAAPTEARVLRFKIGMKARCKHCAAQGYASPAWTNWDLQDGDAAKGIWVCPHKHRISDALMDIVDGGEAKVPDGIEIIHIEEPSEYPELDMQRAKSLLKQLRNRSLYTPGNGKEVHIVNPSQLYERLMHTDNPYHISWMQLAWSFWRDDAGVHHTRVSAGVNDHSWASKRDKPQEKTSVPRTFSELVHYQNCHIDQGAFDRAISIAQMLEKAGRWNPAEQVDIWIDDPYEMSSQLGLRLGVADLICMTHPDGALYVTAPAGDDNETADDVWTPEEENWLIEEVAAFVGRVVDKFQFRITGQDVLEYVQEALIALNSEGV